MERTRALSEKEAVLGTETYYVQMLLKLDYILGFIIFYPA